MTGDRDRSHDDTVDDKSSGAYALDALEGSELVAFERRLAESEDLRAEVAGFTDTAALLAATAPEVAPPPALKASLLALIETTPQNERTVAAAAGSADRPTAAASTAPVASPDEAAGRGKVVSIDSARSRRGGARRLMTGVVAAAAAVVLFAGGIAVGNSLTDTQRDADQFAQISAAADAQRLNVELPSGGSASLLASAELEQTALVFHDVGALPDDEVYQAWYVREDGPVSAGVLSADGGSGYRVLDPGYSPSDVVALTVEPAGGSEQPTTDPIVFSEDPSA